MLIFWKLQWMILYRTLKKLGVFSVVLLLFLFVCGYVLTLAPFLWTIGLYTIVVVAYHFNRRDISLLSVLYERRLKHLVFAQYMLIALPFIGISLSQGRIFQSLAFPIVSLVAFLPNKVSFHHLSHPFLTKGNYEFISGFRKNSLVYILLIILAIIGAVVNNNNLVFVTIGVNILIIMSYYNMAIHREYFLNYPSAKHFFQFKLYALLKDYGILQAPFFVIYSISSQDVVSCLSIYILGCFLVIQALSLRVLFSPNILMQLCMECILIVLAIITGLYLVISFLEILVSLVLYSLSYMKIKTIIRR